MAKWADLVDHVNNRLDHTINIALVGKYVALQDAYISVNEALKHAGYVVNADIKITKFDSEKITKENVAELMAGQDGIINQYRAEMEAKGLVFSGTSPDNHLVEVIEIPDKRFFVASQYHPEFLSRPQRPEGLFKAFIAAANQSK